MTCSVNGQHSKKKAPGPCVIISLLVSHKRLLQIYLRGNKRLTFHSPLTTHILQRSRPLSHFPATFWLERAITGCALLPPRPVPPGGFPGKATARNSQLPLTGGPPVCSVNPTVCLKPRRLQDTGRTTSARVRERNRIKKKSQTGWRDRSRQATQRGPPTLFPTAGSPGRFLQVHAGRLDVHLCYLSLHRLIRSGVSINILQNQAPPPQPRQSCQRQT